MDLILKFTFIPSLNEAHLEMLLRWFRKFGGTLGFF